MTIRTILSMVARVHKDEGVRGVLTRVYRKLKSKDTTINGVPLSSAINIFNKRDVIGFYEFITFQDVGVADALNSYAAKNTINWLIPDFGVGSGGHLNIFRFITMLERNGYKNNICLVGSHRHSSPEKAKALISEHFFKMDAEVFFGIESLPEAEFSFATGWTTAYYLRAFKRTLHKLYFVQDFEPSFYAGGSEYAFAEQTYKFGFTGVCAGNWLASKLNHDYGMKTHEIGFSYDRELYFPHPVLGDGKKRVFCYFRPPTIRRGLETALIALDRVATQNPAVEFIFAGWDMNDFKFDHPFLNAGLLSLEELPDVYSKCDLALVLSYTNLSLLPLEIMACGCVVVSNEGPNVEWLLNNNNAQLTSSDPVEMADKIGELLHDSDKIAQLRKNGIEFANSTSWEDEGLKLVNILKRLAE
ncbi:glycosyltransferase family 4 protein [Pantoea anthophila]|uniref:Glycosyltransferase family 4 protein n=1 Tax=Pantoea anthophila TaxID=470931 RepID=A0ABY2ZB78_9GAMM|nr:glycosyltransferase family 4 protein [Pantoea anthophila]TPV29735.1 glycosyltransferase family 4 protein [Pantoea anthophila]